MEKLGKAMLHPDSTSPEHRLIRKAICIAIWSPIPWPTLSYKWNINGFQLRTTMDPLVKGNNAFTGPIIAIGSSRSLQALAKREIHGNVHSHADWTLSNYFVSSIVMDRMLSPRCDRTLEERENLILQTFPLSFERHSLFSTTQFRNSTFRTAMHF